MGIYERIKEASAEKGYSINRLEKELCLPRSSISKYNKSTPSIDKIKKIADFLDISVDRLLTGDFPKAEERRKKKLEKEVDEMAKDLMVKIGERAVLIERMINSKYWDRISEYATKVLDAEEMENEIKKEPPPK